MFTRFHAVLLACLFLCLPALSADFAMQVTDNGYLNTQGFSVFLYSNTFHPVFVDEKNTAMQLILHGERIANNGDVRLMPTPEQWDLVAQLKDRHADKEHNRLVAKLSFPTYQMDYRLEVTPEPGGVRVSVNLNKPLPEKLAGRAGFSLEFLPSIYMGKTFAIDGKSFGVFPRSPQDAMQVVPPSPDDPKKLPYQEEWDKDKGYTQPLPFASGNSSITFAPEDALHRITISSETGPLALYDGRNRAQNGWFVLRTMIPSGKTEGAVIWHIRPDVIPNWTRPPMIAHSQVGYPPDFPKVAVLELDPKFDAPKTARILRLSEDGSYKQVFEGPVSEATPWLRYTYRKFDFSTVKDPGLYAIEYGGQRTELFPIAKDVYSKTWQSTLDGYLAVEMDHVSVREGYRLWHGVSHLDDARQAPAHLSFFDDYRTASIDSPYKPGEHIPGLNVGGWYDAGDYDIRAESQYTVIQNLALAYREFGMKWDQLTVDETARTVEMHRPDGVPDTVQQVKHGVLQLLAQIKSIGHPIPGIIDPTLRQYTHLGDAASKTDGRIYSAKLKLNEIQGDYSGTPDDRWAFTTKLATLQYGTAASLAMASQTLKGWDDPLSKECLDTAIKLWNEEHAHPTISEWPAMSNFLEPSKTEEWKAAIELLVATNGGEEYKKRVRELLPTVRQRFKVDGWRAVEALPYMDADFKNQLREAVKSYVAGVDAEMAKNPFGVPPSMDSWGGADFVVDFGVQMYFLHKAFPELVSKDYTLRVANYILGTHPVSSTSWVSSVGTSSKLKAYGNNRADNTFIPGGVIPGYIVIKPDFPECIDDFGFLWFENEYVIDIGSRWVLAANAADALAK